jgi:hypothetical protein
LRIDLPSGTTIADFPELEKLASAQFRYASLGKYIYCTCIGTVSYANGFARFELSNAERVWAADK